jgi:hypothetical protein
MCNNIEGNKGLNLKDNNSDMRMKRGLEILQTKTITENVEGSFSVPSPTHSSGIVYEIRLINTIWVCTCPDFEYREIQCCKHIEAVKLWIATNTYLQEKPRPKVLAEDTIACNKCGSIRVVKYGISSPQDSTEPENIKMALILLSERLRL